MPLGKKWRIEFETSEPIGDNFIEGMVIEGVGTGEDRDTPLVTKIKITCLKEATEEEYKQVEEAQQKFRQGGRNE